jgi:lipoprotein-releasing system permease protein
MRPLLALVAIAACITKHSPPKQKAKPADDRATAFTGSAEPVPNWAHDPPDVLRDKILAVNAHVVVLKGAEGFADYRNVLALAERTPGVVAVEAFGWVELLIAKPGKPPVGIAIKGVDPGRVGRVLGVGPHMKTGSLDSLGANGEPPAIVIGDDLARKLDAHVGDTVTLTSPSHDGSLAAPEIQPTAFRVTGLFHMDFDEYDEHFALVPLSAMQAMLGRGDQVMGIEMTVKELAHSDDIAKAIEQALGGPPYQTQDWYELNTRLFHALYGDRRP